MTLSPIDLPDDGMRLIERGHIGQYGYTVQANHGLVARVVAERRLREMVKAANWRLFKEEHVTCMIDNP